MSFVEPLARTAIVLLLAPAFLLAARRSSAAIRHWICFLALAAAVAMPLLAQAMPDWDVTLLPAADHAGSQAVAGDTEMGTILVAVWLLGSGLLVSRLVGGLLNARGLCRRATQLRDPHWRSLASRVRREVGLRRGARLLVDRRIAVPVTCGFLRPVVILPKAALHWPTGRRRAVLIHELSHIRRRDCLTQIVADVACVLYWFHPLVWVVARRMRHERELACDDRVLARGARPSAYASLLLRTVQLLRGRSRLPAPALALGLRSGLESRIRSLLQPQRSRRALTADHHLGLLAVALVVILPLAALRPVAAEAPQPREGTRPVSVAAPAPSEPVAPRVVTTTETPPVPVVDAQPKETRRLVIDFQSEVKERSVSIWITIGIR
jgi:beta-lactamase regulating signal transducer with metallopeptidase domain